MSAAIPVDPARGDADVDPAREVVRVDAAGEAGEVELALGDWETMSPEAAPIRFAVFVQEQGIPAELEWDPLDGACLHCVARVGGMPVATGRLLPDGHIGRMAVLPEHRRGGIGARVLAALIFAAQRRGHASVALSAQAYVTGFYARHGFVPEGAPYDEVGIPHQAMRLTFAPDAAPEGRR